MLIFPTGISILLDSTISSLNIRLPDEMTKTKYKNTENNILDNIQNDENLKRDNTVILNNTKGEENMKNEKISSDKVDLFQSEKKNLSDKEINNSTDEMKISEINSKEHKFQRADDRQKLQRIDQILGFDAEKDKNDFFSGKLEGVVDDIKNFEKNRSKNQNQIVFENLFALNPSISSNTISDNNKFPSGKYEPNPLFSMDDRDRRPPLYNTKSGDEQNRKYNLTQMGISINRNHNNENHNTSTYSDGYSDRNNLIDRDVTSYLPSAPPIFPSSFSTPSPSFVPSPPSSSSFSRFLPNVTPPSLPHSPHTHPTSYPPQHSPHLSQLLEPNYRRKEQNENENEYFSELYEKKLKNQKVAFDKIEGEIGFSGTKTTEFPSFPPSNYPPEGTAIRALRAVQRKQAELNRTLSNSSGERSERENETELNNKNKFDYSNIIKGNKENLNFMNHNYVLPSASAPVSDRIEYLNNMKRMRLLVA